MSTENEILAEVDALKARFSDVKSLYREVCALLFFRYGITPTSSKLYQYVRKGSMAVPVEALGKFWDELRVKARVEINHPDLPPALATTAAEAIGEIWRQATAVARDELAAVREEVQAGLEAAQARVDQANEALSQAGTREAELREQLATTLAATDAARSELEAERRSHTATSARLLELQRHHDESKIQLERQREQFTKDLELSKQAAEAASAHLEAAERRAALEVEKERQARLKVEKAAEATRNALSAAESKAKQLELEHAAALSRQTSEIASLQSALAASQSKAEANEDRIRVLETSLDEQRSKAIEASAEAATLRSVLEQSRAAPKKTTKAPKSS
jgi:chromosome segregation ATPase